MPRLSRKKEKSKIIKKKNTKKRTKKITTKKNLNFKYQDEVSRLCRSALMKT